MFGHRPPKANDVETPTIDTTAKDLEDYFDRAQTATAEQRLTMIADLRDRGVLTPDEFAEEKAFILGMS